MYAEKSELVHATLVKVSTFGVLILGPSGAGKSALALALIDQSGRGTGSASLSARLVADDQVCLRRDRTTLQIHGSPPGALAGLLEIRGLGIVYVKHEPECRVDLVVRIKEENKIERLPDFPDARHEILGQAIPVFDVSNGDMIAAARIRAAIGILLHSNAVEKSTVIR